MSETPAIYAGQRSFTDGRCSMSIEPIGNDGDFDLVISFEGGGWMKVPMTRDRAKALAQILTHAATATNVRTFPGRDRQRT